MDLGEQNSWGFRRSNKKEEEEQESDPGGRKGKHSPKE